MDQPECPGSNCLLSGNSKQHAMFGFSCNFDNLECPFMACPACLLKATCYLASTEFDLPLGLSCPFCYGLSLSCLTGFGKYTSPVYSQLPMVMPGYGLTSKPGPLSFELLADAWHYAISQFVYVKQWTKEDVKEYLTMLWINKTTIDYFMLCCCNHLLIEPAIESPQDYADTMVAYVEKDHNCHPQLYTLPAPPAAWSICCINQRFFVASTNGLKPSSIYLLIHKRQFCK